MTQRADQWLFFSRLVKSRTLAAALIHDGALFPVVPPSAAPRRVRSFPGLKPEGLAQSGAALVVVFDAGDDTPQWMEQRWPAP